MTEVNRKLDGPDENYQSLLSAIFDRYSDISETASLSNSNDSNSSCSSTSKSQLSPSASSSPSSSDNVQQINSPSTSFSSDHGISFYIPPAFSPKMNQSGSIFIRSISLVMSDQNISHVGNCQELANSCKNVQELDLSKNEINDWDEIKKILTSLKKLRLLNLSLNPLTKSKNKSLTRNNNNFNTETSNDNINDLIDYFHDEWQDFYVPNQNMPGSTFYGSNLNTLILNSCYIDLSIVECLVEKFENLSELHLSSNNYSKVTFSSNFVKPSVKILYFNNNNLTSWNEVCKLGKCFPSLENLVLSHNDLSNFGSQSSDFCNSNCFKNLQILIINKLKINDWSVIDQLREFPHLKHVRIQNIPLLNTLNDEEKYYLLVAHLDESIDSLNGSKISMDDKENCERKYIRHFMDVANKPKRYYELESKHGKLNKLADVNLEIRKRIQVKISYGDKHIYEKVDVRQTVGDFKKKLEKFVGQPSSRFKLFYIDMEAHRLMLHFGTEELKLPNRRLLSLNVREGDEFEIDLKPPPQPPVIHSASEHQFQHTNNNLHNLHFHHYNSHFNNNSHHLFNNVSNFSLGQASSASSKPLPIGNSKNRNNIANKNNSNESLTKQRNISFSKQKNKSAIHKQNDEENESNKTKESSINESKDITSHSLPANLSSLVNYKKINENLELLEDSAMDTSVEFTLDNEATN